MKVEENKDGDNPNIPPMMLDSEEEKEEEAMEEDDDDQKQETTSELNIFKEKVVTLLTEHKLIEK